MMDRWRSLLLWCVLLIFGLTACEGGSGSSGFDIRSENAAIEAALTEQRCVQHESLAICPAAEMGVTPSPTPPPTAVSTPTTTFAAPPSSTPTIAITPGGFPTATASPASSAAAPPTPSRTPAAAASPTSTVVRTATVPGSATPTATATPTSGVQQVEIDIDPRAPVLCASVPGGGCAFMLPFAASGFPPDTTFRVAVRTVNPNGRWMISGALTPDSPETSTFDAPVDIGAPVNVCCGAGVQAAVLAFDQLPAGVPASVDELADTGAYAAFVTEPFTVQSG
jgi:hypothetical protein